MRDLNHPDMQHAVDVLSDRTRVMPRAMWREFGHEPFLLTVITQGYPRRLQFTQTERDLIIAHLTVIGAL